MRQINTVKLSMDEVCDVCANIMNAGETAYAVDQMVIVCDTCQPSYEQLLNNEPNETAKNLANKLAPDWMPDNAWISQFTHILC